ncbi:MAG: flagellar basal body P-ring formation chaperone FlgA [Acidobacteriota bacterium]|nr:flagellar basal body P-ring formation chaperone FlgA [Acidobacteriota bacterium]
MIWMLMMIALDGELSLKRQVEVTSAVYLSDVLTPSSYNTLKASGVKNLWIMTGPDISRSSVVNREQVAGVIHRAHPGKHLSWKGPGNVVVRRRTVDLDRRAVERSIRDWVAAYRTALGTVHVDQVYVPPVSRIPVGKTAYTVRPRGPFKPAGRHSLWVDIEVNGESFKTIGVQVGLSLEALAATVTGEIQREQPIGEHMIDWDYVRLDRLTDDLVTPETLAGMCAKSIIRPGTVLTTRHVKPIAVVKRNEPITVIAKSGPLVITMRAVALETGGYGQTIRLKNPDTGKTLTGRIEKDGNVHMDIE